MAKENLIHIRLNYSESINAKKSILTSQMTLLRIARRIKKYEFYRSEEIEFKQLLYKKARELKSNIVSLEKVLPKTKLPEILKKNHENHEKTSIKNNVPDDNIERQLQEIQNRLKELQSRNV